MRKVEVKWFATEPVNGTDATACRLFSPLSLHPNSSPGRTDVTWWNTEDGLITLVTEEA